MKRLLPIRMVLKLAQSSFYYSLFFDRRQFLRPWLWSFLVRVKGRLGRVEVERHDLQSQGFFIRRLNGVGVGSL